MNTFIHSHRQNASQDDSEGFFFTNKSVLNRGQSLEFKDKTRKEKLQEIDFLYNQYNLFKYGKVLTKKSYSSTKRQPKFDLNPEIKKAKNSKEILKGSEDLKMRLTFLKDDRNQLFENVKKFKYFKK